MGKTATDPISQVIAITSTTGEDRVSLKKNVRDYLGAHDGTLYLGMGDEILLTARESAELVPVEVTGSRIRLPGKVVTRLSLEKRSLLAMIQRGDAVALKRLEIVEQPGDRAQVVDVETAREVARVVRTNPMPDELLPRLRARHGGLALQHDVQGYLRGQRTLAAWQARQLLGTVQDGDGALREALIEQRLCTQREDGSWDRDVVLTARHLRELALLGLTQQDAPVQRAAAWLVDRPQSAHNPGMFFAADYLVEVQANIVAQRAEGKGGRFRELKRSEQKRIVAGDDLIRMPCGPRIMWPNALVLEALLRLGYEGHDRVQTALRTMTIPNDWCECGYQHGLGSWGRTEPLTTDEIAAFEESCIQQYRRGGFRDADELKEADLAHRSHALRVDCRPTAGGDEYCLRMPDHIQGCEFITTRAMSQVKDKRVRRFAEAHLWRFAGIQRGPKGEFPRERHGTGFDQIGILEAVARYDHPASRVMIARSLPWIVEHQNEDGSWGTDTRVDVATLAVIEVLRSLGDDLPTRLNLTGIASRHPDI